MTRAAWLGVAAIFLATSSASGAVAPSYQRLREIQTVAARAAPLLRDPIDAVEFVETDLYRVRSGACSVEARIVDARAAVRAVPMVGRRRFRVMLGEPQCR